MDISRIYIVHTGAIRASAAPRRLEPLPDGTRTPRLHLYVHNSRAGSFTHRAFLRAVAAAWKGLLTHAAASGRTLMSLQETSLSTTYCCCCCSYIDRAPQNFLTESAIPYLCIGLLIRRILVSHPSFGSCRGGSFLQ